MHLKTKFNIKDRCYFLQNNSIVEREIKQINILIDNKTLNIIYTFLGTEEEGIMSVPIWSIDEKKCFIEKEDLIKTL
jgi:hypothetical protein